MFEKRNRGVFFVLGSFLEACLMGGLITAGAVCGLAQWMAIRGLSRNVVWPFATAALILGSLIGSYLLARIEKKNGLLCGSAVGGLFSVLLYGGNWMHGNTVNALLFVRMAVVAISGSIGGYIGLLRAERVSKHRK